MIVSRQGTYDERLFSGGFRTWWHEARFLWLQEKIREFGGAYDSVIELGCNDAKTLRYLPRLPKRYLGIDRDQRYLNDALRTWRNPEYTFAHCERPEDLVIDEQFDIGICMEVMEHLRDDWLEGYMRILARSVRHHLFVTVPNEKGLMFGAKQLVQRVYGDYYEKYTLREFWDQLTGNCHRVVHEQHKGFDYDWLAKALSEHFVIESKVGIPFPRLPISMGFTVGIIARPLSPLTSGGDLSAAARRQMCAATTWDWAGFSLLRQHNRCSPSEV